MKYRILISMMMLLLDKRKLTAQQIADRYGVSKRSVYRYVEELNVCGVPIDVVRGRYGGLTVADTFRLPTGFFTREEYSATVNALTAMSTQVENRNVLSALEKLQRRQKEERRPLSVSADIIVDGGTWGGSKRFSEKMKVCESAVNERKCLFVDYISREGEHSKRIIEPHVLIYKQNVWYVYAYCRTKQQFRTFKIGRIKSATFTGETFEKREFSREEMDFDLFYANKALAEVTLEIDKNSVADAEEWLGVDVIEPRGNAYVAHISLPDDGGLVNKILSYGGAVKVLSPADLKQKVKAAAKAIAEA